MQMNYYSLDETEKSALKKYNELEQMELLGCTNENDMRLKSYIKCSIGPEKTRITLPSKIMLDIQNNAIQNCRIKKRNKAQK